MELTRELLRRAYLSLKADVYHDNLNLFLKQRLARFECERYDEALDEIFTVLNSKSPATHPLMKEWLKKVDYRLLPKSVRQTNPAAEGCVAGASSVGLFLTNVTTDSSGYRVDKVNYFIDAPIELHIIDTLWCMAVGPALEPYIADDAYSNRLDPEAVQRLRDDENSTGIGGKSIFLRYFDQYKSWRDGAIRCAQQVCEDGEDVAIFSVDLASFFYHVDFDYFELADHINGELEGRDERELAKVLTDVLLNTALAYRACVEQAQRITHPECEKKNGLPIGLGSSGLLTNWYLRETDKKIHKDVRPAYYGRYVDDIIMVFRRPQLSPDEGLREFIERYLPEVLKPWSPDFRYRVSTEIEADYEIGVEQNSLPVQSDKLFLQFFDRDHSKAGLDLFLNELEQRASAFHFLTDDAIESELDKYAYDVLYKGSVHRPRSVIGIADNETEFNRYLAAHIQYHRLCNVDHENKVLPDLERFFRGVNVLHRPRLWEKVYQYAVALNKNEFIESFYKNVRSVIDATVFESGNNEQCSVISGRLCRDLQTYNNISAGMSLALMDVTPFVRRVSSPLELDALEALKLLSLDDYPTSDSFTKLQLFVKVYKLATMVRVFRLANLVRHNLVCWPLLNFTNYRGSLVDVSRVLDAFEVGSFDFAASMIDKSPRFLHFDEWQLFHLLGAVTEGQSLADWFDGTIEHYKEEACWENFLVKSSFDGDSDVSNVEVGNENSPKVITVAIANLVIREENIVAAVRPDRSSNTSLERQQELHAILDQAHKAKADLLVMPEVSLPVSWLPFLAAYSRRNQIGLVFGLEHWVAKGYAYNILVELLPFKASDKYKSCAVTARLKNHYSPKETELIKNFRLRPATELAVNRGHSRYHRVHWRGVYFSSYNCYELANIEHRMIFKSQIDLMIACVWNKDTNYFSHILESAVRDVHCYVVHANTSQHGGSCILQPTSAAISTLLFVKGGTNPTVLTGELNIPSIRSFHAQSKRMAGDIFKQVPPGFDSDYHFN